VNRRVVARVYALRLQRWLLAAVVAVAVAAHWRAQWGRGGMTKKEKAKMYTPSAFEIPGAVASSRHLHHDFWARSTFELVALCLATETVVVVVVVTVLTHHVLALLCRYFHGMHYRPHLLLHHNPHRKRSSSLQSVDDAVVVAAADGVVPSLLLLMTFLPFYRYFADDHSSFYF